MPGYSWHLWSMARDDPKHPMKHKISPTAKNDLAQSIKGAGVEKPSLSQTWKYSIKVVSKIQSVWYYILSWTKYYLWIKSFSYVAN